MPPKAKAVPKAKAAARPETALQRNVRLAIAAGNEPALSRTRESLSLQKANGGRIVLEAKGIQTRAGVEYHRQKGTRWAPKTIQEMDWNQPPKWDLRRLNQFIVGRDGRKHIVTRFNADRLQGQRTRLGERYYQESTNFSGHGPDDPENQSHG